MSTTTLEAPAAQTSAATKTVQALDLTKRPPRSPRQKLGGFVILPRTLDKGRAKLAGVIGEYHFNCPLDKRFLSFVGIDADQLLAQLEAGKGDGEILAWIHENAKFKRAEWEIEAWSRHAETKPHDTPAAKEKAAKAISAINPNRNDVFTQFDVLDLDDYVSFGGKA